MLATTQDLDALMKSTQRTLHIVSVGVLVGAVLLDFWLRRKPAFRPNIPRREKEARRAAVEVVSTRSHSMAPAGYEVVVVEHPQQKGRSRVDDAIEEAQLEEIRRLKHKIASMQFDLKKEAEAEKLAQRVVDLEASLSEESRGKPGTPVRPRSKPVMPFDLKTRDVSRPRTERHKPGPARSATGFFAPPTAKAIEKAIAAGYLGQEYEPARGVYTPSDPRLTEMLRAMAPIPSQPEMGLPAGTFPSATWKSINRAMRLHREGYSPEEIVGILNLPAEDEVVVLDLLHAIRPGKTFTSDERQERHARVLRESRRLSDLLTQWQEGYEKSLKGLGKLPALLMPPPAPPKKKRARRPKKLTPNSSFAGRDVERLTGRVITMLNLGVPVPEIVDALGLPPDEAFLIVQAAKLRRKWQKTP